MEVNKVNEYKCRICWKSFSSLVDVARHVLSAVDYKHYPSYSWARSYLKNKGKKAYFQAHPYIKKFDEVSDICKVCGKPRSQCCC